MQTENSKEKGGHNEEKFVEVVVVTTSGNFPEEGFKKVPDHQKISVILKEAVKELKIVSTENWVATVDGKEIKVDASYIENGLSGEVTIDYGASEGGGGINE